MDRSIIDKSTHLADFYRTQLVGDVLPFWNKYSLDHSVGGFFNCLRGNGEVYDTDKFLWLQCRQVWTYCTAYLKVQQEQTWADIAAHGIKFLKSHGRDRSGHFVFSVNREGLPLTFAFNIYTECFAALAFTIYYAISGDEECRDIGLGSLEQFIARRDHPKGIYNKYTNTRYESSLGIPMMTLCLLLEIGHLLPDEQVQELTEECITIILQRHLDNEIGVFRETASDLEGFADTHVGRLVNPGHGLEACWFLMDVAVQNRDRQLLDQIADICLSTVAYAWDEEFAGIYYFMDAAQKPLQQLEWDRKLWWPHLEALIALSRAYLYTGRIEAWHWFEKIHDYAWEHFHDRNYGEWFGYLDRQGKVLLDLKGGKWKGCFHAPRALLECSRTLSKIAIQKGS